VFPDKAGEQFKGLVHEIRGQPGFKPRHGHGIYFVDGTGPLFGLVLPLQRPVTGRHQGCRIKERPAHCRIKPGHEFHADMLTVGRVQACDIV
jgi:hypothetical protein